MGVVSCWGWKLLLAGFSIQMPLSFVPLSHCGVEWIPFNNIVADAWQLGGLWNGFFKKVYISRFIKRASRFAFCLDWRIVLRTRILALVIEADDIFEACFPLWQLRVLPLLICRRVFMRAVRLWRWLIFLFVLDLLEKSMLWGFEVHLFMLVVLPIVWSLALPIFFDSERIQIEFVRVIVEITVLIVGPIRNAIHGCDGLHSSILGIL